MPIYAKMKRNLRVNTYILNSGFGGIFHCLGRGFLKKSIVFDLHEPEDAKSDPLFAGSLEAAVH